MLHVKSSGSCVENAIIYRGRTERRPCVLCLHVRQALPLMRWNIATMEGLEVCRRSSVPVLDYAQTHTHPHKTIRTFSFHLSAPSVTLSVGI